MLTTNGKRINVKVIVAEERKIREVGASVTSDNNALNIEYVYGYLQ